jgi:hypothetical protein
MHTLFLTKQSQNMKRLNAMNDEHQEILMRCHLRMQALKCAKRPPSWRALENRDLDEQLEHGPEYAAGNWFGEIHNHERQRLLRAVSDLENGGLLVTYRRWGRRLSHIRLTAEGEKIAKKLLSEVLP